MPKTTRIDIAKADKRKAAIEALEQRGPAAHGNSAKELSEQVALLEERFALLEEILGL